ncbi:MAG: hypothetical protein ACRD0H_29505, partial [Actinomycetes bacterium]
VPIRARDAEDWVAGRVDWSTRRLEGGGVGGEGVGVGEGEPGAAASAGEACVVFGRLVAGAAVPIDDHRSTAAYRRRAVEVCAGRALGRVLAGWEPGV